jgi:DNA-binding NtrC family response regulator
VLAATNRSLLALVQAGRFRADLFYRLAGVEIFVPPLRARREDIPLLVDHFMARHRRARPLSVSSSAQDALVAHDWPGNVRQLARVLERAVALTAGPTIGLADLPADITKEFTDLLLEDPGRDDSLRAWSSRYVRLVLERCQGNKRRACDSLDISYHTLQAHLAYGSRLKQRRLVAPPGQGSEEMNGRAACPVTVSGTHGNLDRPEAR